MNTDYTDMAISLRLRIDTGPAINMPRGPGWYLDARHRSGESAIVDKFLVHPSTALSIAACIDRELEAVGLATAVNRANTNARDEMQRRDKALRNSIKQAENYDRLAHEFADGIW